MTHKRKHPRTLGRFVSDEVRAGNETINVLRSVDRSIFQAGLRIAESEASRSRLRAIADRRRTLEVAHQDDPLRTAAEIHLKILNGAWYPYWQSFLLHLKGAVRLLGRELLYATIIPLKFLLIIVFNVAWVWFLLWLILG